MSPFGFGVRALLRDLRAGELSVLIVAILVAVTAMTAVGFFTDRVGRTIRAQAGAVLAGDLEVRSASPITDEYLEDARALGLETAEVISFPTMVLSGESNTLALLRAVTDGYPLRGEMQTSTELFGEVVVADGIPPPGEAWAEPGLLGRMDIDVGAELTIGESSVRVTRVLEYQPGQAVGGFAQLAPGVLVNLSDLDAFKVVRPGSRITYRQLYAGNEDLVQALRADLKGRVDSAVNVRGLEDAGEQINAAIDRAQRFLTLASLVTVILAAVATAMAARRYALRHLDNVALMKSMGATQSFIQWSMVTQLLLIIASTAVVGSLFGYFGQKVLVALGSGIVKVELPPANPAAGSLGLLTAATITLGFALPHLWQLNTTSPMRVLRHDLPPPRLSVGLTYGIAVFALLAMVFAIVRDLRLLVLIAGGLAAVAALAMASGWLLVRSFGQFRGAAGVAWRYGLANISRRGAESIVQIVAFALSLMVLLLLTLVRTDLLDEWAQSLPEDLPNYFLINIEPEEWPGVQQYFSDELGAEPQFLPFIRGRVTSVNGQPIDEVEFPDPRGQRFARQESNFTWAEELPETNTLRAGRWWGEQGDEVLEISLEVDVARNLGVGVGDTLGFNVGGEEFEAPVSSIRFIEWDSFAPNFYVMLSPGLADTLPQTYIASVYVPPEKRRALNGFVRQFPGVTLLDLDVILGQVRMIIDRASMAVQYVFLFTLLAGVTVLLAAIQITRDERRFESAILHTLGADRRTILRGVAVEFIALGSLAGILAAIGATGVGLLLAEQVFQLDYTVSPWLWFAGWFAGAAIVGLTGTFATRKAVTEPPVAVLREA
jgi:putative ABC transport system permease protein